MQPWEGNTFPQTLEDQEMKLSPMLYASIVALAAFAAFATSADGAAKVKSHSNTNNNRAVDNGSLSTFRTTAAPKGGKTGNPSGVNNTTTRSNQQHN